MESVNDILRHHIETERVYSSYWKFSLDRKLEERHVAACLLAYLEAFDGWRGPVVESTDRDPPDCRGIDLDGRTFGIEVSELVHRKTVEQHELRRNAERRGVPVPARAADPYDVALWTASALKVELSEMVRGKDKPAIGGPFSPYLVAIFTAECTVTPDLVAEAITGLTIESHHIDGAYLLLSYDPRAEEFPNRIPVFRIPVSKET